MQLFAVSVHVGDGALSHAAGYRGLHHGGRDLHHQARIKRFGDQVLGSKGQGFARIGGSDHLALLGLRQVSDGMYRGNFHLRRDGGRSCVQGATKDVGEAQDIVDLVGVVGATGGHDGVVSHLQNLFGQDLRRGVGQCHDDGPLRHFFHHLGLQNAAR